MYIGIRTLLDGVLYFTLGYGNNRGQRRRERRRSRVGGTFKAWADVSVRWFIVARIAMVDVFLAFLVGILSRRFSTSGNSYSHCLIKQISMFDFFLRKI